jgi:type IV secretory pathway TrbD component
MLESVLYLVLVLVIVGFALWLLGFAPLEPRMLQIIRGVVIVAVIVALLLWLARGFGGVELPRWHR